MMSFTEKRNQFDEAKSNMDRTDQIARDLMKFKKYMDEPIYKLAHKHMMAGRLDKAQKFIDDYKAKMDKHLKRGT